MKKIKAAIYARVSTDKQEYTRQFEELKKYAERNDISVEYVFEEKESGLNSERPKYNELTNLTKEDIDLVLIWEISRLSRKSIEIQTDIQRFTSKGINVFIYDRNLYTLMPDGSENPTTKLIIAMIATIAEEEIKTLKKRSISTKQHNVLVEKKSYTSQAAFGYNLINKQLYINEEEAEIVKYIFNLSIEGNSLYSIAVKLNAENIKNRKGKHWTSSTIGSMLSNTAYYGKAKYVTKSEKIKSEVFTRKTSRKILNYTYVDCPAIISKEIFDLSQQKKKTRTFRSASKVGTPYLLKHLIKCKDCGTYFTIDRNGSYNKYRCARQFNKDRKVGTCGSAIIKEDYLNFIIWDLISTYYRDIYVEEKKNEDNEKLNNELEAKAKLIESIDIQINNEYSKVNVIYQGLQDIKVKFPALTILHKKEEAKLSNLESNIKRLDKEKAKINNDIILLKEKIADLISLKDIDINNLSFEAKYEFLHKIIDTIYVNKTSDQYEKMIKINLKNNTSLIVHYSQTKKTYTRITVSSGVPDYSTLLKKDIEFKKVNEKLNIIKKVVKIPKI